MHQVARLLFVSLTLNVLFGCEDQPANEVTFIPAPAASGSIGPHLASGPRDTAVLSWLEPTHTGFALRYATFIDDRWSEANTVAQGADWLVNWTDTPSVVPISQTLWSAHWLVKHPGGGYAYDVAIALSPDAGRTWGSPITPHRDGTKTEHGFVSLFPWNEGVGVVWLDGRKMLESSPGNTSTGMTLRTAMISPTGELSDEHLVDEFVCDCCQTDVVVTNNGPAIAYRDRTSAEIRDVFVSRYQDGQWRAGHAVADDQWEISGCPINGPAITSNTTASKEDSVGIAWFTAAQGRSRVRFARSEDAGSTFSPAVDVDTERALGRVDTAMLSDGAVAVSWLRRGLQSQGEIVVRRVSTDDTLGPVRVIAQTSTAGPTGFPQMIAQGEQLLLAWTHIADGESSLRTARVSLASLR